MMASVDWTINLALGVKEQQAVLNKHGIDNQGRTRGTASQGLGHAYISGGVS
jgi:hypothetical protein